MNRNVILLTVFSGLLTDQSFPRDAMHKRGLCRHAVSVCPSVCVSVTFVICAKTNKDIFEIFSPSSSQAILVFPYQTGWAIPTGTPLMGASNASGVWKNDDFRPISSSISETVIVRWVHAARGLASIELSFHSCNILHDNGRGVSRGKKNVGCDTWKQRFFALAVRITGKLLKIDGYMLRGVGKHWIVFSFMQRFA